MSDRDNLLPMGTRVRKIKGSSWQGRVVGCYSTSLTPEGYAIESDAHPGSVQIYPRAALEVIDKGSEAQAEALAEVLGDLPCKIDNRHYTVRECVTNPRRPADCPACRALSAYTSKADG